ncbi:MAG: moderate conductance mechanosensitive channel, partial [Pseudonocardiales bacterium]|nr:moderate conductance mechanosensitive channel [Pseudonocardiales bacterium]
MSSAESIDLVALPKFWEDHKKVLIEIPIRVLAIIIVALIIRAVLRRMIDRAVRPVRGEVPRILRPFKEKLEGSSFLESAGLLSERRAQRAATLGSVLKSAASITIFAVTFLLILGELQINLAPFIAGTSIVGVALGFGAQNIVKDFLAGIFMLLEDQYGVGDVIDFQLASGTVEEVGLRSTRLRDVNGTVWYVRNGEVLRVGNKSQGFAQVVLDIPLDAWADVDRASEAMRTVSAEMAEEDEWAGVFLNTPEVQGVESMTREETVIRLVVRTRPGEQFRVARELRRRIRERLDRLDGAARLLEVDHVADAVLVLQHHEDAGQEVLDDVLRPEAERDADDGRPGDERAEIELQLAEDEHQLDHEQRERDAGLQHRPDGRGALIAAFREQPGGFEEGAVLHALFE